ncbi:MAG: EAL domain-containing protein [Candidatus Delongbacteria bacterium]|nr:EAL domain-containing protein [Candidatus Delongbacteria bacterium]
MLEQIARRHPPEYRYRESDWYSELKHNYSDYQYQILRTAYLVSTPIPIILYLFQIIRHDWHLWLNYLIPFLLLIGSAYCLKKNRQVKLFIVITIVTILVGFYCALFLPGGEDIHVLILLVFTQYVFQLLGVRQGRIYSLIFLLLASIPILMIYTGILDYHLSLTLSQYLVIGAIYLINYAFMEVSERRHEYYLSVIIEKLTHDHDTGLPTKEVLLHSLDPNQPSMLMIVSIENFSELVTVYGYELSERIIINTSTQLQHLIGMTDYRCYRLRGHEFGLLIKLHSDAVSHPAIENKIHAIWNDLNTMTMKWNDFQIKLCFKIGATIINSTNYLSALSEADIALVESRRLNTPFKLFNRNYQIKQNAVDNSLKLSTLIENIEQKCFKALYQPIIDVKTNQAVWYEALLRIRNRQGDYVSPADYMEVIKASGISFKITEFMFLEAVRTIQTINKQISINVNHYDLLQTELIDLIKIKMKRDPSLKEYLIFEITEYDKIISLSELIPVLRELQGLGLKIAVDDFGSGYSNFNTLFQLPIEYVKIDGSLIQRILIDENAHRIVETIQALCRKIGKKSVAEYVDRHELYHRLKEIEIDYCQGYLWGEPKTMEDHQRIESQSLSGLPTS